MHRPALRLIRSRLCKIAAFHGYAVSGNLVFTAADFAAISAGRYRPSVLERPAHHGFTARRIARLVSATY